MTLTDLDRRILNECIQAVDMALLYLTLGDVDSETMIPALLTLEENGLLERDFLTSAKAEAWGHPGSVVLHTTNAGLAMVDNG